MMNYYPFHVGDFLTHTVHLTEHEELIYRRMLDLYYLTESPFKSPEKIARRVRSDVDTVRGILDEFFILTDDGLWRNRRADEEIADFRNHKEAQTRAGKASAKARNQKKEDERR
ncbi:MAG: YdaU family protein, partial [Magnetococcales bacterium]|nr:YdaU family protein [Magnetococcales bacterium]